SPRRFPMNEELSACARQLGFIACGVASLEPSRFGEALDAWLRAGYGGTMRYLHRRAAKRKRPGDIVAGARVAVVVLESYLPAAADGGGIKIAKYARGEDYHRVMMRRLGLLANWLRAQGATVAHPWTDAGPVPERELAQRAGLGWIGKNTMLIRPESGSFCLIGSVFTDLALEPARVDRYDRCGSCTRCLEACPTGALLEPRLLDATRCISYLTIESRRPVPDALVEQMEGWGFGCDICNDVCPWNERFAVPSTVPEYQDRGAVDTDDSRFFETMSEDQFAERFGDTPLSRPGLSGMRRNWAAAARSLDTR
ncbi:MAG TPA: tRNA epoxyqueuosine(34) reductase QueG, partial [Gemmatimonadales bacterium]|nr:tRNA epoxyqueuosine(34) reductase QueG [Gemmatimonadales bacterium]